MAGVSLVMMLYAVSLDLQIIRIDVAQLTPTASPWADRLLSLALKARLLNGSRALALLPWLD